MHLFQSDTTRHLLEPARETLHKGRSLEDTTLRSIAPSILKDRPFLLLLVFAVLIRLALMTMGTGSDEIIYIAQGEKLLAGDIGRSDYLGAIRYGTNFIEAASLWVFGKNAVGASGLYFIFSILDIILVYKFASLIWGRRPAIWASICLATIPLHVVAAGDWLPDPWLVLVIDASFVALYIALHSRSLRWFVVVGFLAGLVFWIKEAVSVYGLAIGVLLLLYERRPKAWFVTGGVALIVIGLNFAFFRIFYGDSGHLLQVFSGAVHNFYIRQNVQDTSPFAYFFELFRWPYFASYVGFVALAGVLATFSKWWSGPNPSFADKNLYVIMWALSLLLLFSFLPISLHPLKFIGKQSNYMLIFTTPLCLLAGYALAAIPRPAAVSCGILLAISGVFISTLDQQRWQLFTANGHAAVAFAAVHPDRPIFGTRMIHRQSVTYSLLQGSGNKVRRICSVEELGNWAFTANSTGDSSALVIIDEQNLAPGLYFDCAHQKNPPDFTRVGTRPIEARLTQLPACWTEVTQWEASPGTIGRALIAATRNIGRHLPHYLAQGILTKTERYWVLHRAKVYSVTRECVRDTLSP